MVKRILTAALLCATSAQAQDTVFPTLFTNVNVFDGVSEALIEDANVLVVDNLIAEVMLLSRPWRDSNQCASYTHCGSSV